MVRPNPVGTLVIHWLAPPPPLTETICQPYRQQGLLMLPFNCTQKLLYLAIFELTKTKNKYYYDIADKDDVTKEPIKSSFSQQCHKNKKFIEKIQISFRSRFRIRFYCIPGPGLFFSIQKHGFGSTFCLIKIIQTQPKAEHLLLVDKITK